MTLLFLACTFLGWLMGTLTGLVWGHGVSELGLGGFTGLALGVTLAVFLERQGGVSCPHDSLLANFVLTGLSYYLGWMLWMELACQGQTTDSRGLPLGLAEGGLVLPMVTVLAAAWATRKPSPGGPRAFLVVGWVWCLLLTLVGLTAAWMRATPCGPVCISGAAAGLVVLAVVGARSRNRPSVGKPARTI